MEARNSAFLEFFHFFTDEDRLVAVRTFARIAIKENGHHPVGGPETVGIFQSA